MTTNRNPIYRYFITYPQICGPPDAAKLNFSTNLLELNLKYYIICQETHLDGNPHFHALIWLQTPLSKSRLLKFFKEKYPSNYKRIDVQSVRNLKAAIEYCRKEDPNPIEHPDGPPLHHKKFKYPRWMVTECQLTFGCHPSDMAQEYRHRINSLEKRKREVSKKLQESIRFLPQSQKQCDILENEYKEIVLALLC